MFTRVRVMENPECTNWLEDERKRLERKRLEELNSNLPSGSRISDVPPEVVPITLNQLCTGEEMGGRGGCHGDSGGPLTVQEVSYVLAGVVSGGGRVCGQPRVPSIYTRVAQYAEWLKEVTQENQIP